MTNIFQTIIILFISKREKYNVFICIDEANHFDI
jgi:hypothetical protein